MLSFTAKFCCSRFPLRISTLITVMFGRVNLGATKEQPLSATATHNTILGSRGNMEEMIPIFASQALIIVGLLADAALAAGAAPPGTPAKTPVAACLATGDGYLRAKLAGAVN